MIQVTNLTISYADNILFEDASFTLNPQERCALVGRNGSGKTTLFRLLSRQEHPDKGTISFSKNYQIGYLDQHIKFSKNTVLEEALLGLKEEEREFLYKAEKILFGLGFNSEQIETSPEKLSGGYQLRLHLAKVLLQEPDCLLLDEPTNYLDIISMRFLQKFLQKWKKEFIVISHDREFLDSVSTHTLGIHRKKITKIPGSTINFYNKIVLEEELQEKTRQNLEKKKAHLQAYIDRFGAKASKASQAQSKKKILERIPSLEALKDLENLDFSFPLMPFGGKKMVEAKNISFSYEELKPLIQNCSFSIEYGEKIGIIGKNGYGKSTLLKLIAGELQCQKGEIFLSNQARVGYFGQTNIDRLDPKKTIVDEITLANPLLTVPEIRRICGQMMFSQERAEKKISVLSGGEKSRVLLGKILAKPCNILLLDEPTQHLDIESVEALIDAMEDFEGAVVLVTHSELILNRLKIDKLLINHFARQELFLGNYEDFLEKKGWEEEASSNTELMKEIDKTLNSKELEKLKMKALEKEVRKLEKEISSIEKRIVQLEETKEKDYLLLCVASEKRDFKKIAELGKKNKALEKEIEAFYEKLITLTDALEKKKNPD